MVIGYSSTTVATRRSGSPLRSLIAGKVHVGIKERPSFRRFIRAGREIQGETLSRGGREPTSNYRPRIDRVDLPPVSLSLDGRRGTACSLSLLLLSRSGTSSSKTTAKL